jgi:hypothetical protein
MGEKEVVEASVAVQRCPVTEEGQGALGECLGKSVSGAVFTSPMLYISCQWRC